MKKKDRRKTYTAIEGDMDESYCLWFSCPKCGCPNIMMGFRFCPCCGIKIKTKEGMKVEPTPVKMVESKWGSKRKVPMGSKDARKEG